MLKLLFGKNKEKGSLSLIFVIFVGLFILTFAFMAGTRTFLELQKNRNTFSGDQALYAAESAAREGIYQYYLNNPDYQPGDIRDFPDLAPGIISNKIVIDPSGTKISGQATNVFNNLDVVYTLNNSTEKKIVNWSEQ